MNLSITGLYKVPFKNATANTNLPVNPPIGNNNFTEDKFEKSNSSKYSSPDYTKTSIFYISDLHGKMTNMERICAIAKQFDGMQNDSTKLKFASGDILLGSNPLTNKVACNFLNWVGVEANALGNHELDATPEALSTTLKDAKYTLLASNVKVKPNSAMNEKIKKSMIIERDGQKFGVIGTAPSDALERVGTRESLSEITIDNTDDTIKNVQEEVDKLISQGINKIILLSHSGKEADKKIASATSGIDVILGAHTHDIYKGVVEGENLVKSKTGEPVVLTQIGKDGEFAGILNAVFDKNGVLVKVQNNVVRSGGYTRTLPFKTAVESIIGKPEILGTIKSAPPSPSDRLLSNNPHGNFIVDAMRKGLNTDIALLNTGNIRGFFISGDIDRRRINDITPFEDKMMLCELSEKQIVDALKVGGTSFANPGHKPGLVLVSGLEYSITDKGELLDVTFTDKNGNKSKFDVNNPSTTKKYTVACDDFFAYGGDNYLPPNKNPDYVKQVIDADKNVYTAQVIKEHNGPIEIKEDDRIKIIKT